MESNKVRVFNPGDGEWMGTQYEIDGKRIDGVRSVDFHVSVEEVPQFTFEMMGKPDIEMSGNVSFHFTPQTVQEAAAVITKEFQPNTEPFKAMVASVEERLRYYVPEQTEIFRKTVAEDIVRQFLGVS